jgi:hypothetical protein
MANQQHQVSFHLVNLYEVGILLGQVRFLIEAKKTIGGAPSLCVQPAMNLLRLAFRRLFTAAPEVAGGKSRVEVILDRAWQAWNQRFSCPDERKELAEVAAASIQELVLLAERTAEAVAVKSPGALDWLQLGMAVVRATGGHAEEEDLSRLGKLLAKVGGEQKVLLPEITSYQFSDDFPGLPGEFQDWYSVEVGLKHLQKVAPQVQSGEKEVSAELEQIQAPSTTKPVAGAAEQPGAEVTSSNTDQGSDDAGERSSAGQKSGHPPKKLHLQDEGRPEKYRFGPLEGNKTELAEAVLPSPGHPPDRRRLFYANENGMVWAVELSGQRCQVYFPTEDAFNRAQQRLEAYRQ